MNTNTLIETMYINSPIVDPLAYEFCSNQINMFVESGDEGYIKQMLNEFYHVGSHAKANPRNSDYEHATRISLKPNPSKRKTNFWKNVIQGINSHIGRIQTKAEKKDSTGQELTKKMSILSRRLKNRRSSLSTKSDTTPILFGDSGQDLQHEFDNTAYGRLLNRISKETGTDIPRGGGGKPNVVDTYAFSKKLRDQDIDYDNLLSDETKKELLSFEKDLRMTSKRHKLMPTDVPANSVEDVINPQDPNDQASPQEQKQGEEIEKMTENVKKQAEKAPKSWIGKKIRALRNLYSEWLEKRNKEHSEGKIGFFNGILRIIANCIDWLLEKLQNFAG